MVEGSSEFPRQEGHRKGKTGPAPAKLLAAFFPATKVSGQPPVRRLAPSPLLSSSNSDLLRSKWALAPVSGWLVLTVAVVLVAWVWRGEGWLHSELIPVSQAVWSPAHNSSLLEQLKTTLVDWHLFESSSHRLRPLSDLTEVIDAILRPLQVFGFHPSLSLTGVLLAVTTAAVFHLALLRSKLDHLRAALLTLLLVTTIGYLSCYVPYIRPAKKLALLFTALTLLFTRGEGQTRKGFSALCLSLFLSFFADEAGFVLWPIALILSGPALVRNRQWPRLIILLGLPLLYLLVAKGLIPALYTRMGIARNMEMSIAGNLIRYCLSWKYYMIALDDFSSAVLVTFGVLGARPWQIILGVALLVAAATWGIRRQRWEGVAAIAAAGLMSFSLTLFDWFNTPFNSNAFGALTFYYHSPVAMLAVFALAQFRPRLVVLLPVVTVLVGLNLFNFGTVNRIAMIMHTYPLEARALPQQVESPAALDEEYHRLLLSLHGQHTAWLEKTFTYYKSHPMGGSDYVKRYVEMYQAR